MWYRNRMKHVEVERFFIKEKLDRNVIEIPRVKSKDQLVNVLTKAVWNRIFAKLVGKLGMFYIYAQLRGSVRIGMKYCNLIALRIPFLNRLPRLFPRLNVNRVVNYIYYFIVRRMQLKHSRILGILTYSFLFKFI